MPGFQSITLLKIYIGNVSRVLFERDSMRARDQIGHGREHVQKGGRTAGKSTAHNVVLYI